jgi:hypothetical protein
VVLIFFSLIFYSGLLQIIPPGVEFGHIIHDFDMDSEEENPSSASEDPPIWSKVTAFSTTLYTQSH